MIALSVALLTLCACSGPSESSAQPRSTSLLPADTTPAAVTPTATDSPLPTDLEPPPTPATGKSKLTDPSQGDVFGKPYFAATGRGKKVLTARLPAGTTSILLRWTCEGDSTWFIRSDTGKKLGVRRCRGGSDLVLGGNIAVTSKKPLRWTVLTGPKTAWRVALVAK